MIPRWLARAVATGACVLAAAGAGPARAADPTPDTTPSPTSDAALTVARWLTEEPDERIAVLSNGLTVILRAHRAAPVVAVRMYCKTGSVYEQEYAGAGVSHLFEHLLAGGATIDRTEAESEQVLDELGRNANAFTSFSVTCYYVNTAADNLARAVELLADWITHPTFPDYAFERELGVVQRELERDLDDPGRQLLYMTQEALYLRSPARFPIIGYQQAVQSLSKDAIVSYYKRMYVPDNVVVAIAGDMDLDAALDVVAHAFASFSRRPLPTITLPQEDPMTAPRTVTKQMNVQAAVVRLAWPSIKLTDPDLYALDLLSYALTEGESSRLVQSLVREQQLAYTIDSFSWTPEWARGVFAITARLDPANIEAATASIWSELRRLQVDLLSDEELDTAKRQKAAEHVFALQTAESVADAMARDFIATGDAHFSDDYVARIQEVTPEQVREVARKYLVAERTATISILPRPQTIARATTTAAESEPARRITMDNGLRVILKRDPTAPVVAMQLYCLGGLICETPEDNGIANMCAELLLRGTTTRTAEEIARFFDSRGATIDAGSGNNTFYVRAQVLAEDFDDALPVFADVVLNPAFPPAEVDRLRPRILDAIARVDETWRSELDAYFRHRFFKHSPYRMLPIGSTQAVSQLDSAAIAEFYRRYRVGPNAVLAIFGDIDPAQTEAKVRALFSAIPAEGELSRQRHDAEPPITAPALYIKAKGPDRRAAGIYVGYRGMTVNDVKDRYPTVVLDTIMSGYGYPGGWLHNALRGGQNDLVYEVHAQNMVGVEPGYFGVYAACQPDRVSTVYQVIQDQVEKARAGSFSEDELRRAKGIILTTDLMRLQTSADRATLAALDELYGLGFDHQQHLAEYINAVTLDDVRRVAKKYLTEPIIAVVTPEVGAVDFGVKPAAIDRPEPAGTAQAGATP
jgi:zinc protease